MMKGIFSSMQIQKFNLTSSDKKIKVINENRGLKWTPIEDVLVCCDCSYGSFELDLDEAIIYRGIKIYIAKTESGIYTVTVNAFGNQTINAAYSLVLSTVGMVLLLSDGEKFYTWQ
jgi:hypothetical protein